MKISWLSTAALTLALGVGSGAVIAQQQSDSLHKRDEGSRSEPQSPPSREGPAAREERPSGGMKDRMTQEGAKEPRRGEVGSPREQAQGRESREQKQPARQSQEQPGRGERPTAGAAQQGQTQQGQEERRGREAERAGEPKRQSGREDMQKQDRATDTAKPGEQKLRQGEQQPARGERPPAGATQQSQEDRKARDAERAGEPKQPPGREQAAQPSQQNMPPGDRGEAQRRENVGRAQDQATGRTSMVNDEQRTQIVDRMRRERDSWRDTQNLNIRVTVGERLPERVRPRPLPPDIVRIAPQYREYEYTMIEDEIAIVDPRSREIVDVIDERGGGRAAGVISGDRTRYSLSTEQRTTLRRLVQSTGTVGSTSPGASADSTCVTLRPVPEDMARSNPDLAAYRYVAIGNQIVLVDPREQKVVDVIE
jgi:Protein of unknown function (DUF1236)